MFGRRHKMRITPYPPRKRWWRWPLYIIGILILVLGAAYAARGYLFAEPLGRLAARKLSEKFGGTFAIARIDGTWFGDVVIRDLRTITPPDHGPIARLEAERLDVSFRLSALLIGNGLSAIESISGQGCEIAIDKTRAKEPGKKKRTPAEVVARLPHRLPKISLDGKFSLRLPFATVAAGHVTVSNDGDAHDSLTLAIEQASMSSGGDLLSETETASLQFHRTDDGLVINASRDLFEITAPSFTLSGNDWRCSGSVAGGTLECKHSSKDTRLIIDGIAFERVPRWLATVTKSAPWLPSRGHGDADVKFDGFVEGTVSLTNIVWKDFDIASLSCAAGYGAGAVVVDRVDIDGSRVHLQVQHGKMRLGHWPEFADLAFTCVDLGRLVAAAGWTLPTGIPVPLQVAVQARCEKQALTIDQLALKSSWSSLEVNGGVRLSPTIPSWKDSDLDLHVRAKADTLAPLHPQIESGKLQAALRIAGNPTHPDCSGSVALTDAKAFAQSIDKASVVGGLAWPRLRLDSATAHAEGADLAVSGEVDLSTWSVAQARCDATVTDLSRLALPIALAGKATASLSFSGTVWPLENLIASNGSATLECDALTIGKTPLGQAILSARLSDRLLLVDRFHCDGESGQADSAFSIARDGDSWKILVERFACTSPDLSASLRAPLRALIDRKGWSIFGLALDVGDGHVDGLWSTRDGMNGDLAIDRVKIDAVARHFARGVAIGGTLSGTLHSSGTSDRPKATLTLSIPDLLVEGRTGSVDIVANQDDAGLQVERIFIDAGDMLSLDANGRWPFVLGASGAIPTAVSGAEIHAHGKADLNRFASLPVTALATLQLDAKANDLGLFGGTGELIVDNVALAEPSEAATGFSPLSFSAKVLSDEQGLALTLSGADAERAFLHGELRTPALVSLGGDSRQALSQPLEGTIAVERLALAPFAASFPGLVRLGGEADLQIRCSGTLLAPQTSGSLKVGNLSLKMRNDVPAIEEGHALLSWSGHTATLERLDARMGYAPVSIQGTCDFVDWSRPVIAFTASGTNVLLLSNQDLRVRGTIDRLSLDGPIGALRVAGKITITDALYSKPVELLSASTPKAGDKKLQLFSFRGGPRAAMSFDLSIAASESIRIDNNLVKGKFSADLTLQGTGAVPEPRGLIFGRDARLTLPFTTITIDAVELRFRESDPFDPFINAIAHATIKRHDMRITINDPASNARVNIESDLSPTDAEVLLTTGVTPDERDRNSIERTSIGLVGTYVAKELLRWAGGPSDPDKQDNFSDRFDLDVKQNETGNDSFGASYRLSTKESLDRGHGWFLETERDKYEDYNFGILFRFRFRGGD